MLITKILKPEKFNSTTMGALWFEAKRAFGLDASTIDCMQYVLDRLKADGVIS
jgi:hypothetical protein